jgi:hypothetical protein
MASVLRGKDSPYEASLPTLEFAIVDVFEFEDGDVDTR